MRVLAQTTNCAVAARRRDRASLAVSGRGRGYIAALAGSVRTGKGASRCQRRAVVLPPCAELGVEDSTLKTYEAKNSLISNLSLVYGPGEARHDIGWRNLNAWMNNVCSGAL
jgi:hypothetical protein